MAATPSDVAGSDLLLAKSDQRPAELFASSGPAIEHSAANGFSSSAITAVPQPRGLAAEKRRCGPFSTVAVGVQASSLGVGGEAATPLARSLNLRGGMHLYTMAYGFGVDGASYDFQLHLRTGQISVDWFPFHGGFHISPGLVIYKSDISGAAQVAAGSTFQLGPTSFSSSISDPVHGTASLTFSRTVMPSLTFGFSNMIPRSGRHWSMPLEVGAAYMGHTAVQLNLQGTACVQGICLNTNDPTIQQDVVSEQSSLNEAIKRLQAYPIISSGFAYRF